MHAWVGMIGVVALLEWFSDSVCVDASSNFGCKDDKSDIPSNVFIY